MAIIQRSFNVPVPLQNCLEACQSAALSLGWQVLEDSQKLMTVVVKMPTSVLGFDLDNNVIIKMNMHEEQTNHTTIHCSSYDFSVGSLLVKNRISSILQEFENKIQIEIEKNKQS